MDEEDEDSEMEEDPLCPTVRITREEKVVEEERRQHDDGQEF